MAVLERFLGTQPQRNVWAGAVADLGNIFTRGPGAPQGLVPGGNLQRAFTRNQQLARDEQVAEMNRMRMQVLQQQLEAAKIAEQVAAEERERQAEARGQVAQQFPGVAPLLEAYPSAASAVLSGATRTPTYGKTPQYARTQDGKLVMVLTDDAGNVRYVEPREGAEFLRPVTLQNLGGQVAAYPYGATTPVSQQPVTLKPAETPEVRGEQAAAAATAKAIAEREQEAIASLPNIEEQAATMVDIIDQLKAHPGMARAVGASSLIPIIPGTPAADFDALLKQAQGQVFMQVYEGLKGAGQLTEKETEQGQQSFARLQTAQSEEAFVKALDDLREVVVAGRERARRAAAAARPEPTAADPNIEMLLKQLPPGSTVEAIQ